MQLETIKLKLRQGTFYFKYDRSNNLHLVNTAGLFVHVIGSVLQEDTLALINQNGAHPTFKRVETKKTAEADPPKKKRTGFSPVRRS